MWLIITFIVAVAVTTAFFLINNKKYKLNLLALMLWGTFIMILVDHVIAFISEGGEFIEFTTEGFISSGAMLGIVMLSPIVAVWAIAVYTPLGNKICIE
ncbi:hypothetical protein KKB40_06115 [Patescibacteria group bacterium]|nr:hypothetical protein [Patescibacteria group bacterium]